MELTGPSNEILYKDTKKQYDSFTWTTNKKGEYKFCFSNEFSTFTHKVVYFDFQVGEDGPLSAGGADSHSTAMTQVTCVMYISPLLKMMCSKPLLSDVISNILQLPFDMYSRLKHYFRSNRLQILILQKHIMVKSQTYT